LTLSVRSFHVPWTPSTFACPPNRPSVPTSNATRVTSLEKLPNRSTISLIVTFKSSISPLAFTSIVLLKSPYATALVTSEIERTCPVRFDAIFCEIAHVSSR
jgi:hypothetical protein